VSRSREVRLSVWLGCVSPVLLALGSKPLPAQEPAGVGGSIALTSDYEVRGISRSDEHPAAQIDLHYANGAMLAGLFASSVQIDPSQHRDVELSPYIGYVASGTHWQTRALVASYRYPWNAAGHAYDYDELEIEETFHDWLDLRLTWSPDWPAPDGHGVDAESLTVTLQHRLASHWSGDAGGGYFELDRGDPRGYAFWGLGMRYEFEPQPLSITLSVIGTTGAARALFYNAASRGNAAVTLLWRF